VIWINGTLAATHEDGETPFTIDATDLAHYDTPNHLALRVIDPLFDRQINGFLKTETPRVGRALAPLLHGKRDEETGRTLFGMYADGTVREKLLAELMASWSNPAELDEKPSTPGTATDSSQIEP